MGDLFKTSSAVLSDCGLYRYRLDRRWGDGPTCGFIMLNPSTADADMDDPTIRRCIGFAKREGYGGIIVVNLYAFRATSPKDMQAAPFPFGPDNHSHLTDIARAAYYADVPIICAWGANDQGDTVKAIFREAGVRMVCLGRTKDGSPRHPLYVRADQPLEDFA